MQKLPLVKKKQNQRLFERFVVESLAHQLHKLKSIFLYFRHKLKSIMYHSKRIPNNKNSILPAPIHFNADELLYLYNKCNENLHLLSISYPLVRNGLAPIILLIY